MEAAIDDRKRQRVAMSEQEHDRHIKQAVDGAGNAGKLGSRVLGLLERDGEEQIGFHRRAVVFAFAVEQKLLVAAGGGADFIVRKLENEINGLPVRKQSMLGIEVSSLGEGAVKLSGLFGMRGIRLSLR